MKKVKINTVKKKLEVLTREQLRFVMGGDLNSCQEMSQPCDTEQASNCCFGLHCVIDNGKKVCYMATL